MLEEFESRQRAINADLARLKDARQFAEDAATDFGLADEGCYQVKLAMCEAVTNAIQHGSASEADRIVICAVEEAGALVFYVKDSGRFVPRIAPRGELPESGRGLEFMGLVMDELDVRPGSEGTVLRFAKRPEDY